MKIEKHIHDLLFHHDCVIIPGLGGFIANYQPAIFNPSLQIYYPPSKKVAFNAELKENDGLLAKYVSGKHHITYDEANKIIHEFVRTIYENLNTNKLVELNKIGVLKYNQERNIEFVPGNESNFLISSFGMAPVQAPLIKRLANSPAFVSHTNQEISDHPIIPLKRGIKIKQPWKILEVVPIAALLFYIILFPGSATKINSTLSQLVPDINLNFSEFFNNNLNEKKSETQNTLTKSADNYATSGVYVDDESNKGLMLPEDVILKDSIENTITKSSNVIVPDKSSAIISNKEILDEEISEKPKINTDKIEIVKAEPVEEVKAISTKPTPIVNAISATEKYHIIGGAFGVKSNAENYLKELKTYGYNAQIIGTNKRGLYMVSVLSTNNQGEMKSELYKIKKILNDKVWVFSN